MNGKITKLLLSLTCAGQFTAAAQAQLLMGMGAFFNRIKTQPGRVTGAEFAFPAYVRQIELTTARSGALDGVVELGNDNAGGVITTWGANELRCLVSASAAARLVQGQRVAVTGTVISHSTYPRPDTVVRQVTVHVVVARCDLQPSR